jgi:hypothetical protein
LAIPIILIACAFLFVFVGHAHAIVAFGAMVVLVGFGLSKNQNVYVVSGGVKQRISKAPTKEQAEKLASFVKSYIHCVQEP